MKRMISFFTLSLLVSCFYGCKENRKSFYSIGDFRKELQPHLISRVAGGIVGGTAETWATDLMLDSLLTETDLWNLTRSEHPVLRGEAMDRLLNRPRVDSMRLLLENFGDTALVRWSGIEYSTYNEQIGDHILRMFRWKSQEQKNKIIGEVITKYEGLKSACTILPQLTTEERFYPLVKAILQRSSYIDEIELKPQWAPQDFEYALYGLARYRKREDIPLIKEVLMDNLYQLHEISFWLMRDYPDTAYLDVLERFTDYLDHRMFTDYSFGGDAFSSFVFFETVASYKIPRSYKILDHWFMQKPPYPWGADLYKISITKAIQQNPSPVYYGLASRMKPILDKWKKLKTFNVYFDSTGSSLNGWNYDWTRDLTSEWKAAASAPRIPDKNVTAEEISIQPDTTVAEPIK
jgi:hypothetical protein